jgi:hypothetical protein
VIRFLIGHERAALHFPQTAIAAVNGFATPSSHRLAIKNTDPATALCEGKGRNKNNAEHKRKAKSFESHVLSFFG